MTDCFFKKSVTTTSQDKILSKLEHWDSCVSFLHENLENRDAGHSCVAFLHEIPRNRDAGKSCVKFFPVSTETSGFPLFINFAGVYL